MGKVYMNRQFMGASRPINIKNTLNLTRDQRNIYKPQPQ